MLLWFAATSLLAMRWTFGDAAIDHRLIVAGALLPEAAHLVTGGPVTGGAAIVHSVTLAALALVAVMAVTIPLRRVTRRRWLALPIGIFWHQVFDATWTQPALFWWPLGGDASDAAASFGGRGLGWVVAMEIAGLAGCLYVFHAAGLRHSAAARESFWRRGRLEYAIGPRYRRPRYRREDRA